MGPLRTLFCDWLSSTRAARNKFEWETVQTQSHVQTLGEAQRFGWQGEKMLAIIHIHIKLSVYI